MQTRHSISLVMSSPGRTTGLEAAMLRVQSTIEKFCEPFQVDAQHKVGSKTSLRSHDCLIRQVKYTQYNIPRTKL